MGLKRVITYWLLLALLAHLLRGINSVVPPVQSSIPVVETFPLDYVSVHMPKGPGLNATLHRLTGYYKQHHGKNCDNAYGRLAALQLKHTGRGCHAHYCFPLAYVCM